MRECPYRTSSGGAAQLSGSVADLPFPSVAIRPTGQSVPTLSGRGRGRGGVSGSSGPLNRLYALASRQDPEASPDVFTGILSTFSEYIYIYIYTHALVGPDSVSSRIPPRLLVELG